MVNAAMAAIASPMLATRSTTCIPVRGTEAVGTEAVGTDADRADGGCQRLGDRRRFLERRTGRNRIGGGPHATPDTEAGGAGVDQAHGHAHLVRCESGGVEGAGRRRRRMDAR